MHYGPIQRITFEEVSVHGTKTGKCGCGKRRVRKMKFWSTLNPFNKNPDGTLKTYEQLKEKVNAEREAWMKEPIVCDNCPTQ